jgi:hypothetical protein
MMLNPAHGTYEVSHHGPVMFLYFAGSSNLAGLKQLLQKIQACRAEMAASEWAILGDLRNWEGLTPDAMAFGQEILDWCAGAGMRYVARAFSAPVLANMIDRNLADPPAQPMMQASFLDLQEALAWLAAHGVDCAAVEAFLKRG